MCLFADGGCRFILQKFRAQGAFLLRDGQECGVELHEGCVDGGVGSVAGVAVRFLGDQGGVAAVGIEREEGPFALILFT